MRQTTFCIHARSWIPLHYLINLPHFHKDFFVESARSFGNIK